MRIDYVHKKKGGERRETTTLKLSTEVAKVLERALTADLILTHAKFIANIYELGSKKNLRYL